MRSRIYAILLLVLLLIAGCGRSEAGQTSEQTEQNKVEGQTVALTVLQKSIKDGRFILEVSGQGSHRYIEITESQWSLIEPNDTVTVDERDVVVKINNEAIE